jgi:hypothetical protein
MYVEIGIEQLMLPPVGQAGVFITDTFSGQTWPGCAPVSVAQATYGNLTFSRVNHFVRPTVHCWTLLLPNPGVLQYPYVLM